MKKKISIKCRRNIPQPAASIVLSGEKLKAVLQQGTRRQYPLSPLLLNRILEALARTVRKKNQ